MRKFMTVLLCLVSVFMMTGAQANADYAREKKWADEIVPGIVVGDPVYLKLKQGHRFLTLLTEAKGAKVGLVVVHGLGVHPDWGMVGALRTRLAGLGYTTLSVQMPVLANEATEDEYIATYPEAEERIAVAVNFLKARGYPKIAIVSHSMGSFMSQEYVLKHQSQLIAWASLGFGGESYARVKIPVLDMYGQNDMPFVLRSTAARKASLKGRAGAKQVQIAQAGHFYDNHEAEMVKAVKDFLDSVH